MSISDNLFNLRTQMAMLGLDAYIITSTDPHLSEYPTEHWKFREWMSGFTGSMGTLIVTHEEAGLWTDSRYYIQAEKELANSEIDLYKDGLISTPSLSTWLRQHLDQGQVVGTNGKMLTLKQFRNLKTELSNFDIRFDAKLNIEEEIWEQRPLMPEEEIFELGVTFAGLSRKDKISTVREKMKELDATHYIVPSLDEIAWLLNLRGADVDFNPVFYAYLIISQNNVNLFIDPHKITSGIGKALKDDNIKIFLYEDFYEYLSDMPALATVVLDPQRCNAKIYDRLPSQARKIEQLSIITELKSRKNPIEQANIKKAMLKDGIAMVRFLYWLHSTNEDLTEYTASLKLLSLRKEQENFYGESFSTISAYGPNAALPHYAFKKENAAQLERKGFYLVDSGGQYLEGTTDITRTVALGDLTEEEKNDFTLVLKGHIAVATCCFPEGTKGSQIDTLARTPLWKQGLNFGHGTGHGVGYFLNVHEGPQSISSAINNTALKEGMLTSNEPGLYKPNKHGIRIENLTLVQKATETEFGAFYEFETVTLCPIDLNAINTALLNKDEVDWLNKYHQKVRESLAHFLSKEENEWLKEQTRQI